MDSNDRERIPEARNELHRILSEVSSSKLDLCLQNSCIYVYLHVEEKGKTKAYLLSLFVE